MLNLRAKKIIRDIWENKSRTFLVVLTIAISIFSIGSLGRVWVILSRNLENTYLEANPASASLYTARPIDELDIKQIKRMPEIEFVEGRNEAWGRIQIGPDRWRPLRLIVRDDYENLSIDKITPEEGEWPPPTGTMLLERSSVALLPFDINDTVTLNLWSGSSQQLTLAGSVHDVTQLSSEFSLVAYGYVTRETLEELTGKQNFTALDITVSENRFDEQHIEQVVDQVARELESLGKIVVSKDIPPPGKHELDNIMQTVLLLLAILTVLGMFLGVFLVFNIISAQLTQQTKQIGTIKAVGGESRQILSMYLWSVGLFGLLALMITMPIVIGFAYGTSTIFAGLINFEIVDFSVPASNYIAEIAAGLLLPMLAALYPILKASRLTVRESIGFSGMQSVQFGASGIEKLLGRLPELPSTILYPFRNIFRRKVRLALAAFTLSVAGAIWIAVGSVNASFEVTVDGISDYWQEDIHLGLRGIERYQKVEQILTAIEGVDYVEPRLTQNVSRVRPDNSESVQDIYLFGLLPTSPFVEPQIVAGRWLQPNDTNEVVVNLDFLSIEPDVVVGDQVIFMVNGRETTLKVVGISTGQVIGGGDALMSPIGYINYLELADIVRRPGQVSHLLVGAEPGKTDEVMAELENVLIQRGVDVRTIFSNSEARQALDSSFSIILSVLQIASLVFGFVGGLGLTSMMSLNVLERIREIGIIRSVGGVKKQLAQIIVIEGIFVGVLSWFAAALLAYPISIALGNALGETLLRTSLTHVFPISAVLKWLGLVIILSIVASLIPGRNAARLSVRETINYE